MPIGGGAQFSHLLGRVLIAALLLTAYPEISNTVAAIADAVSDKLGNFNDVHAVLAKAGAVIKHHTWSWTSIGDTLIWIVSYLAYFFLYVTVFFFDAAIIYCLVLLYIFSPILIAFFILPQTASLTKGMFRTLFEVACWKVVWSVLGTLLWSAALNNFNQPATAANFVTQLAITMMLIFSIILTPVVTRSLITGTLSMAASQMTGYAAVGLSAGVLSPTALAGFAKMGTKKATVGSFKMGKKMYSKSKSFVFPKKEDAKKPSPEYYAKGGK